MKRKIVKRNKAKMTFWINNPFWYKVVHQNREHFEQTRNRKKYVEVFDHVNAYRITERSERIMVPILITSKVKRSRIKNRLHAYRSFKNLEEMNNECGTAYTIDEIYVGWR
ncbi:hypothetical protein pEaSNUABM50_00173 [Erwinia phage pEa_SNUABM_50]|uniref:Uncharacterized protein n=3 Tax=Eneladusvirus BF TaxID=2560751 RepID=A0A7L8ZN47_9CAUD|nr:hypothetical protein FDH34_gp177 [Serratia phage BF]QOI71658.1 hypothetical protein pEaSNUABM47_00174 [Erwinia phage pEa_SNUABM_47]QOI72197.1 hypothetical protein pEaSNUABM50_00173 [Erwinia phage pEa_SNUABM_50]QXO11323.1 hypothetical protein pEaSNUABM19_00177 [Erwinia phage pEa_SNUABM_19]QXO11871.1 hypothetical protein pEaSNUABM44_00175 [Erwinia phage pEa_SNUABM_44]QXO12423.1 hypothetical protein pEaSNUABM49_00177 [Erwinia phage pEa_SNUABM_49]